MVSSLEEGVGFDAVFVLDSGELRRAGSHLDTLSDTLVNIDHHPGSDFGDIVSVDTTACATGALILRILKAADWSYSREVAICIYTAIISDTGSFRYSNADPEAFNMAAELVAHGVDTWTIASQLYESQPATRLRLLSEVLQTLHVSSCGRFASVTP